MMTSKTREDNLDKKNGRRPKKIGRRPTKNDKKMEDDLQKIIKINEDNLKMLIKQWKTT